MTSISVPTTLANFSHPRASSSKIPDVALSPVVGSKGRLAVAAVHGDGVWTYDVKSIRPTTSFTVPPSTVFASAPTSFYFPKDKQIEDGNVEERVTVVAIESGEGLKKDDKGRVLWVWKGEDDSSRSFVRLDQACHSLHVFGNDRLAAVCVDGSISVLNDDLTSTLASSSAPARSRSTVVAAKVLRNDTSTGSSLRVAVVEEQGRISLLQVDVDSDVRVREVSESTLPGEPKLQHASISDDGAVVAIDTSSRMYYRNINETVAEPPIALVKRPSALLSLPSPSTPLSLIATAQPGSSDSSLVLAVPTSSLPAILSSSPVSTTASGTVSHLTLISQYKNIFVIGVVLNILSNGASRSVVYTCEVSIPISGIGLNTLIGSRERSAAFFGPSKSASSLNDSTTSMIQQLRAALNDAKSAKDAEAVWSSWLETEDAKAVPVAHGQRLAKISPQLVKTLLEIIFSAALTSTQNDEGKKYTATGVYPKKIMRTLVDRKLLDDSMREGGLVITGLLPCGDMRSISRLVRNNPSLPSSVTVSLLKSALEPQGPNLVSTLQDILSAPLPDSKYRVELARQLSVDSALKVLEQLIRLAEEIVNSGDGLDTWPELDAAAASASSLSNIITHCSFILDAHSTSILTDDRSSLLLERLQTTVTHLLSVQTDYRRLRAPIDAALTLASREQHRADEVAAKRRAAAAARVGHGKKGGQKGQGEGQAQVQSAAPEDVIGRWKVEDIVF